MKKAKMSGQDPYLSILDHRNTPTQGLNASPAQRLLSRRTRTLLDSYITNKDKQNITIVQQKTWTHLRLGTVCEFSHLSQTQPGREQKWWPQWVTDPTKWSWTPAVSGDGIAAILGEPWALRELLQHQQQERHRCLHRTLVIITVPLQGLDV